MKKITVIGKGTAGCISVANIANISNYHDLEIEWIYDPEINPQAVGEGTTLDVVNMLGESLGFGWPDLKHIDGNYKNGIRKIGYTTTGCDYTHRFMTPNVAIHFNALKLQDFIEQKIKENYPNVKIIQGNKDTHNNDSDYVLDCSGKPKSYEDYNLTEYIPVNSVYVTQCFWPEPKFDYTLTVARPYGWVWGIPLQNRCSIGYMYNNKINSLEEVKEDVKNIFEEFNLQPSETTNAFSFKNYYRNTNFEDHIGYNGNASFFLEPLEATSISSMIMVSKLCAGYVLGVNDSLDYINNVYTLKLKQVENMINLHYLAGSKYDTHFWINAQDKANKLYKNRVFYDTEFAEFFNTVKSSKSKIMNRLVDKEFKSSSNDTEYGTWGLHSWYQNIKGLNLENKINGKQFN
tara:strand:+ start:6188 stop:7399 length:1212 start_codon:yes stop_codon:yes gene_type:complete